MPDQSATLPRAEPEISDAAPPESCPNCGEPLAGRFCHACGAKTIEREELTFRHFAGNLFQELIDVEHSKLLQTFKALLFKPGFLTEEYFAGRKSRYLSPLRLFLLVFAVHFFAYTVYKPVSMYDVGQLMEMDYTGMINPQMNEFARRKHMETPVFVERVNEKWQSYLTLAPLLIAVCFAFALKVFYLSTGRYLAEHFVFTLHFSSFFIVLILLMWPIYFFHGIKMTPFYWLIFSLSMLVWVAYLSAALRRFYRQRTGEAVIMSLVLCAVYYAVFSVFIGLTFSIALVKVILS